MTFGKSGKRLLAVAASVMNIAVSGCGTASEIQSIPLESQIVDVRTPMEFAGWHFPGAVNIPLQDIFSRRHELDANQVVIVYCRSGNRSSTAKKILTDSGFPNVKNGGGLSDMKQLASNRVAADE
jgi:phage shock protein E